MSDFKNYSGTNIESNLLATSYSHGLMSAQEKEKLASMSGNSVFDIAINGEYSVQVYFTDVNNLHVFSFLISP